MDCSIICHRDYTLNYFAVLLKEAVGLNVKYRYVDEEKILFGPPDIMLHDLRKYKTDGSENDDFDWMEFKAQFPNASLEYKEYIRLTFETAYLLDFEKIVFEFSKYKNLWVMLPDGEYFSGENLASLVQTGRWIAAYRRINHNFNRRE